MIQRVNASRFGLSLATVLGLSLMATRAPAQADPDTGEADPAAGQVVYSDEVEQADWVQDGRGFWTTKAFGGLSAQAGEAFLALRNPNGFTVTSIQREAVLQLQPGRYKLTVRVGAPRSEEGFVGVDRVAIGLFDPQAESSERDAARQLRSRIEQLRQAEGVTFQAVDHPEPAAGGMGDLDVHLRHRARFSPGGPERRPRLLRRHP